MTKLRYGIGATGVWVTSAGRSEPGWYIHRGMMGAELTGSEAVLSVVYDVRGRTHFMMHRAAYAQAVYRTAWEGGGRWEYRVSDSWIMIGWPHKNRFCTHWYISRHGIGAEAGKIAPGSESVLTVDYYAPTNTADVFVAGSHRYKHGRE